MMSSSNPMWELPLLWLLKYSKTKVIMKSVIYGV